MLPRPYRQTTIADRTAIERAIAGKPVRPGEDEPMEATACRMSLDEWFDLCALLQKTYPAEWAAVERLRNSDGSAWVLAQEAYEAGNLNETADMLVMAAIYEARWGGRSSTPTELLVWAVFYRLAFLVSNR